MVWNMRALSCVFVCWTESVSEWSAEPEREGGGTPSWSLRPAGGSGHTAGVAQKEGAGEDPVGCMECKAISVSQRLAK